MPAPNGSTFAGNPKASPPTAIPYRPNSNDMNGIGIQNDPNFPPNPATMIVAELANTWSAQLVDVSRVVPMLVISVTVGPLAINSIAAAPAVVQSTPIGTTFTLARTGGGAGSGDTSITWPANTFASPITQPYVALNGTTPGGICISAITNGIRIVTVNMSNAATDLPYTAILM